MFGAEPDDSCTEQRNPQLTTKRSPGHAGHTVAKGVHTFAHDTLVVSTNRWPATCQSSLIGKAGNVKAACLCQTGWCFVAYHSFPALLQLAFCLF